MEKVTFKLTAEKNGVVYTEHEETFNRKDAPDINRWHMNALKHLGTLKGALVRQYINGFERNGLYESHLGEAVRVRNFNPSTAHKPLICTNVKLGTEQYYHYSQLTKIK